GAGGCLITDAWDGIEMFLAPGTEVLIARDGSDVVEILRRLSAVDAAAIGRAARRRILAEHTYDRRAALLHRVLSDALAARREVLAA
ncbi:MAG TPA: glycosyltransferase, partial [Acetobacteraceae bacterium]|nr:glycosyltransferase [Acetobacteraceae bacterium]